MADDKARHPMTEKKFQKSHSEPFVSKVKQAENYKNKYDQLLYTMLENIEKRVMREIEHAQSASTGLDPENIKKLFATARDKELNYELAVHRQSLTEVYDNLFVTFIDLVDEESSIDRIDVLGKHRNLFYRLPTTFGGTLIVLDTHFGTSYLSPNPSVHLGSVNII